MCKWSRNQGMGQTGKAALDERHTLKEDLSPSDSKAIKQRLKPHITVKEGNSLRCIHSIALTNYNLPPNLRKISWSTWQNSMSVYGYTAEKGLLKGKPAAISHQKSHFSSGRLRTALWCQDWKNLSRVNPGKDSTLPYPTLSGNNSDHLLCGTVEQRQHQTGIEVNPWQFRSCISEGNSAM